MPRATAITWCSTGLLDLVQYVFLIDGTPRIDGRLTIITPLCWRRRL
jgi:hypothetical protein